MSESDKTVRVLTQAVEITNQQLEQMQRDNDYLISVISKDYAERLELENKIKFEKLERVSQERKSDTSLISMLVVCIISAAAAAMNILMCQ